jgi:hypothetical protein
VQQGKALHGTAKHGKALHSTARQSTAQNGTARHCTALLRTARTVVDPNVFLIPYTVEDGTGGVGFATFTFRDLPRGGRLVAQLASSTASWKALFSAGVSSCGTPARCVAARDRCVMRWAKREGKTAT